MATVKTYRAFRRTTGDLPRTIELSQETVEELGPDDVLLKIHAVSLNFRDAATLHGRYPGETAERAVPCSDCSAEVASVGAAVQEFAVGDRVSVIAELAVVTGLEDGPWRAVGGPVDGVLREYAVFDQKYLVHLPEHLSWEEAATIPCAGVTAWNALSSRSTGPTGRSALLQGTGGVSMFALLLCIAAGITPIITSSSDDKLKAIQKLSSEVRGINYKTNPDQAAVIRRVTDGKGVDFVVNNTGIASIPADIESLRQRRGTISLVGFLEGFEASWNPQILLGLMQKCAAIQGISVGSKIDFQALNKFLEDKKVSLSPLIDRVFPFEESKAAFDYLYSGSHVGKVIIKIRD